MSEFKAEFLEIESRELVRFLLQESGQSFENSVDPEEILRFLELSFMRFPFDKELESNSGIAVPEKPRALISFPERIVAVDSSLSPHRTRFSVLHEIGHYVLPKHRHSLFICDDTDLGFSSRLVLEKEASEFAADLLFMGNRFLLDVNSAPVCASSVKVLAAKYNASFEATARRMVEKSFRPYLLVVFEINKEQTTADSSDATDCWSVRYCVGSVAFKQQYCSEIKGSVPGKVAEAILQPGRDIADSIAMEQDICLQTQTHFHAEYFSNSYNIFCFMSPV